MVKAKLPQYKRYHLRAWWYNRQQTAQESATSIMSFLKQLEPHGSPFINWSYLNSRRKGEFIPNEIDEFRKRVIVPIGGRRGAKPEELDTLGFGYLLFGDGKTSESIAFHGDCGGSSSHSCIDLQFPQKGDLAPQLLQIETLKSLLETTVKAWNPAWASIDYYDYDDPDRGFKKIPVYWFTYLPEWRGKFPPLPEQCPIHHIEGYGSYVITTPEPFDREREDHLAISDQIKTILNNAGLLVAQPE
jgi:Immunity protein 52